MLRDRNYVFPEGFDVEETIQQLENAMNRQMVEVGDVIEQEIEIPFINREIEDAAELVVDDEGGFVYVMILEDDQGYYKGAEREFVVREISKKLRKVFPDMGVTKKIEDLVASVHILIVYNANKNSRQKYDNSKYEADALKNFNYEIWPKHMLRFNVTKIDKVPQHIPLSKEDGLKHMNKFNLTPAHMEKVMIDDPVIRYFYGQPKQVFKINRIGQDIGYRIVINMSLSAFVPKPKTNR